MLEFFVGSQHIILSTETVIGWGTGLICAPIGLYIVWRAIKKNEQERVENSLRRHAEGQRQQEERKRASGYPPYATDAGVRFIYEKDNRIIIEDIYGKETVCPENTCKFCKNCGRLTPVHYWNDSGIYTPEIRELCHKCGQEYGTPQNLFREHAEQQGAKGVNDFCTCSEPDVYHPAGTGWAYCRKCDKRHGEYDFNWDSMS